MQSAIQFGFREKVADISARQLEGREEQLAEFDKKHMGWELRTVPLN